MAGTPWLSARGSRALQPSLPYLKHFLAGLADAYDPVSNPHGHIVMAVAENRLRVDATSDALARHSASKGPLHRLVGYDDMAGVRAFRASVLDMCCRTFLSAVPRCAMDEGDLVIGSGCGALVHTLTMLLCEPGDAVLLPTPTYASLYNDMQTLAGAVVVDVPLEPDGYVVTTRALDAALAAASARGAPPRVLFLLHPSNPLGTVMSPHELSACIDWADAAGLHVVVDEIYANSVYDATARAIPDGEHAGSGGGPREDAARFHSAVEVMYCRGREAAGGSGDGGPAVPRDFMGPRVHILWGFSKDWGMSGLRVGALYTHNRDLRTALSNVNYFTTVSNDTQHLLSHLLDDVADSTHLLAVHHAALRQGRDLVCDTLSSLSLPFHPPCAGMFVWFDMSSLLIPTPAAAPPPTDTSATVGGGADWDAEAALTDELVAAAKLVFTPGQACHAAAPGWYRCCFAYPSMEGLREGMARLRHFVHARRAAMAGGMSTSGTLAASGPPG